MFMPLTSNYLKTKAFYRQPTVAVVNAVSYPSLSLS